MCRLGRPVAGGFRKVDDLDGVAAVEALVPGVALVSFFSSLAFSNLALVSFTSFASFYSSLALRAEDTGCFAPPGGCFTGVPVVFLASSLALSAAGLFVLFRADTRPGAGLAAPTLVACLLTPAAGAVSPLPATAVEEAPFFIAPAPAAPAFGSEG